MYVQPGSAATVQVLAAIGKSAKGPRNADWDFFFWEEGLKKTGAKKRERFRQRVNAGIFRQTV